MTPPRADRPLRVGASHRVEVIGPGERVDTIIDRMRAGRLTAPTGGASGTETRAQDRGGVRGPDRDGRGGDGARGGPGAGPGGQQGHGPPPAGQGGSSGPGGGAPGSGGPPDHPRR